MRGVTLARASKVPAAFETSMRSPSVIERAWAAVGDGVLFYDPDNTGEITELRQYVFTEWDPTASSDIEALANVLS
ncbi:MAG: hypothetical protein AAF198_03230 [Pseudomonadota bacterium]